MGLPSPSSGILTMKRSESEAVIKRWPFACGVIFRRSLLTPVTSIFHHLTLSDMTIDQNGYLVDGH